MRQPRSNRIVRFEGEHLRLVLQPADRCREDRTIVVALKLAPLIVARTHRRLSAHQFPCSLRRKQFGPVHSPIMTCSATEVAAFQEPETRRACADAGVARLRWDDMG